MNVITLLADMFIMKLAPIIIPSDYAHETLGLLTSPTQKLPNPIAEEFFTIE